METILLVDDEKNYHLPLTSLLRHEGFETVSAYSGNEAWTVLSERDVDLVLSDMTMPDGDGLELLGRIKASRPEIPVVMLTAFGTVELAVEAMKRGAFDYLTKPCPNDEMLRTVAKALEVGRLERQNRELRSQLTQRYSFGSLIGKSKAMLELYQVLEKVAPTKANVLITGESGTGKELVAQALHYSGPRAEGPFVAVNCSALSPTLLESELFGHEKGSFTDARASRAGRFEMAGGGSLFLDEVGEMDHGLQVKLLRVLQERRFERVGGSRSILMDVRLIAATNRDLKKEVALGNFREDLFYRLNVVHLELPPLRARLDDLPLLTEHFLKLYGEDSGLGPKTMSREALRLMYGYGWPGNIRELGNVIERGVVLSSGSEIQPEDLPDDIRQPVPAGGEPAGRPAAGPLRQVSGGRPGPFQAEAPLRPAAGDSRSWVVELINVLPPGLSLDDSISALEEGLVRAALDARGGVQSHAAQDLGLKKTVFKYKWDKYAQSQPTVLARDLAAEVPPGLGLVEALETLEEALLRGALEASGGVQSQAAEALSIKKNLMQYKLKKFNINPKALEQG
ncbi:MAG: sigma 54-interacting transcriptional regulator [Candidatus Adiutrix sp.]|jgi:two-component system NtrC family response regulator|nr:sigma 54-interacting transcriptional regulator [Candidatus Adiutrix sp.]